MTKTIKKIKYSIKKTNENVSDYFKKLFEIIRQPRMSILPGALAFYMILSVVPIISIIIYILSLFNLTTDSLFELLNTSIPGGISVIKPLFEGGSFDLVLIVFLIWMFYIASNGFDSVIITANEIYGIKSVGWFRRRLKAFFMTFTFVLMLIIILIIPVWGERIIDLLFKGAISTKVASIYSYIKLPLTWLIMFIFIRTTYEFAPDRMRKHNHINAGALFTSIGWLIITGIYSYFANNMANYNILYGTFANVAFLMIWIYFMSFIFVIGMALNYGEELEIEKTEAIPIINEEEIKKEEK